MALEGGGKIKSKGGHSPTKPYEQRKSIFQRFTDSVKDVIRPSWLGSDPTDVPASPTRTVENSSTVTPLLKKEATVSKALSSENSPFSTENATTSPSPLRAEKTVDLRQTTDQWSAPSPNSSGLWSVRPGDSSPDEQYQMDSASSALARSGPVGPMSNSSPYRHNDFSQLRRPPLRCVDSPRSHTPQPSLSYVRQRHLREHADQGNSSFFRGRPSEAVGAIVPSKRQKVWAPETSRKGRPLQPAVLNQPAFKMSVFCSSSLAESQSKSPSCPGRTNYGSASPHRKLSLNNSLSYQSSSSVRKSVTPKPVNRSGSAILSSSTTQIFKTLERLSDTKRAKVDLRDSDSLLSFSPSSYRRMSRPLEARSSSSQSIEVQSLADAIEATNRETVAIPAPETRIPEVVQETVPVSLAESHVPKVTQEVSVPPVSGVLQSRVAAAVTPEVVVIDSAESRVPEVTPKVVVVASTESRVPRITAHPEDEVVISDDSSDDDDVQIIELPSASTGRGKSPGSTGAGALTRSPQQQMARQNKDFQFSHPVKNAQSPCQTGAGSPLTGGFGGFSSSPFSSPPAWGSTAPKPKSIMSGTSKTGTGNRKSVSFSNSKLDTSDSSVSPVPQLKSGSVMDVLSKSPEASSSSLKSAGQPKQGSVMDGLGGTGSASSSSSPAVSSSDGLFAKFTAPAGSWECEVCMVNNAAEAAQCLACQANKPGTVRKAAVVPAVSSSDGLFAKFAAPAGSWECEVCMVNNAAEVAQCLACQANKPGTGTTGAAASTVSNSKPGPAVSIGSSGGLVFGFTSSAPTSTTSAFFPPPSANTGSFGGVQLGPSSSQASGSPVGFKPPAASETGGIKFGTPAPMSSSTGFKLGNSAPQSTDSSNSSGFTFGKPSAASSNAVPTSAGFQFGGKGFSHSPSAKDSNLTSGVSAKSDPVSSAAGGFQFGVSAVNCASNQNISSPSLLGGHSVTASNSSSESSRTVSGIPNHCEKNSNARNADGQWPSVGACDKGKTIPCTSVSPVFSASKTCDSVPACAAQSSSTGTAAKSVQALGCFHSNGTVSSEKSSSPSVFGSAGVSPKVTLNGSDSSLQQTTAGLGTSAAHSGFSFGGANKPEKSPSSPVLSSQNGPAFGASVFAGSKGFVFGSPSVSNSSSSASGAMSKPNMGMPGSEDSSSSAKSAINGEAGAVEKCAFGGDSVPVSPAAGGLSNSSPFVQSTTDGLQSSAGGKQPPSLFAEEKEHIDNGTHAVDGAMPFKFANPAAAIGFKFGQTSGKSESSSGSQGSGKPSGFGFSAQTNAASSNEALTPQAPLFGMGSGTTSTGQFSFSVGAGSQSNAAAAAPLASNTSAPAKGFSFSSASPSSFKFGSGKSSITSTPGFQFASPQSADTASTQSSSSTFTFGKPPLSAKASDAAPAAAAAAVSFAPAPAQNSFSVGTEGDAPRKLKRAVRRVPRN